MIEKSIAESLRERALKRTLDDTDFILVTAFIVKFKNILINEYKVPFRDADNLINDRLKMIIWLGTHSGNPEAFALLFMTQQGINS